MSGVALSMALGFAEEGFIVNSLLGALLFALSVTALVWINVVHHRALRAAQSEAPADRKSESA